MSTNNHTQQKMDEEQSHLADAASQLLSEGSKLANEIYEENLEKINEAKESIKAYSNEMSQKIKDNPVGSLLIGVGIGYLLSHLIGKNN